MAKTRLRLPGHLPVSQVTDARTSTMKCGLNGLAQSKSDSPHTYLRYVLRVDGRQVRSGGLAERPHEGIDRSGHVSDQANLRQSEMIHKVLDISPEPLRCALQTPSQQPH